MFWTNQKLVFFFQISTARTEKKSWKKLVKLSDEFVNILLFLVFMTHHNYFYFNYLGGILATHLLLKTPDGDCCVKMLSTNKSTKIQDLQSLLSIKYVKFNKNSPEILAKPINQRVFQDLVANLEGVDIVIHQNALLDITEKMTKFYEQVIKNAKHLIGPEAPEQNGDKFNNYTEQTIEQTKPPEPKPMSPKPKFQRMNSRKMSFVKAATSVQVANRLRKAKTSVSRQNSALEELPTDLKVRKI